MRFKRIFISLLVLKFMTACSNTTDTSYVVLEHEDFNFGFPYNTIYKPSITNKDVIPYLLEAQTIALNNNTPESISNYRNIYGLLSNTSYKNNEIVTSYYKKTDKPEYLTNDLTPLMIAGTKGVDWILKNKPIDRQIYFAHNSSFFDKSFQETIIENARYLHRYPFIQVMVTGYADVTGNAQYNIELGTKRAERVADYLAFQGVDRKRIKIATYGESYPAVKADDFLSLALNRRVEIIY